MKKSEARLSADWQEILEQEVRTGVLKNERRLSRYAIFLGLVTLGVSIWVIFSIDKNVGYLMSLLAGAFTLYHALLVPRLIKHAEAQDKIAIVRWLNVAIEVSLPGVATIIDIIFLGPAYGLTSLPPLLVFLAVIASGLRTSRSIAIFAGALAGLEYLGIYAFARMFLDTQMFSTMPSLAWFHAVVHAVYLGTAGVLAATVAQMGRSMTRSVVAQIVDNKRISNIFGQYVSPAAAKRLTESKINLGGEQRELTILFVDIRDFTPLAFTQQAQVVVDYLNQYFERMVEIVVCEGGIVNKFMGDGMLAIFGAPEALQDHSLCACRAALKMATAAGEIPRPDGQATRVGVGVHRGQVILGSIGAKQRKDYTVIGDNVNLAARLESLTRKLDVDVLVSENVWTQVAQNLIGESQGLHKVKGRDVELEVFSLAGLQEG